MDARTPPTEFLNSVSPVKTSRPSPGQFEHAYLAAQRNGFESVVSLHISGELSGTVFEEMSRLAARSARAGWVRADLSLDADDLLRPLAEYEAGR